jgi:dienelactone hydrolase
MRGTNIGREHIVHVPVHTVVLAGNLDIPAGARGIVLFAHGSGSSRHSPRNRFVAHVLREAGLATLLIDLLTMEEEQRDLETAEYRFDIPLLADRLVGIIDWLVQNRETADLRIGLFGSSTGAAATLIAAAERPLVGAIVSRGGRVDLAEDSLDKVRAPTLMLVGGLDEPVLRLNAKATLALPGSKLVILSGATHLFEEPGALEEVAHRAGLWFTQHLAEAGTSAVV